MKTLPRIALPLLAIVTLAASAARADGYDPRQKITYSNSPFNNSTSNTRTCRTWVAQPQVESRRACSYEPAASASFKTGDTIVVTAANAKLKIGDRVVATVRRGQRITVLSVQGPWVRTTIEQNGRNVGGWLLASDLATNPRSPDAGR